MNESTVTAVLTDLGHLVQGSDAFVSKVGLVLGLVTGPVRDGAGPGVGEAGAGQGEHGGMRMEE